MPSISDIRFHIKSVRQTRQITNAMYLISTARMRKAIKRIEQNRAYFYRALDTMKDIREHTGGIDHPYLIHRKGGGKTAYFVIAGDKGLAGSYNHDILALAQKNMENKNVTELFTVGNTATTHFQRAGKGMDARFEHAMASPSLNVSRDIVTFIMRLYDEGVIDELHVAYTRFVNSTVYEPTDIKLLPIELSDFGDGREAEEDRMEMLYDPSPEEVFNAVVPQFIIGFIYGALVHAYASENCARMNAMQNATHSADEMLKKLTQQHHFLRQLTITNELTEIVSAANAFNQKGNAYE